jgi:hypothetical protein
MAKQIHQNYIKSSNLIFGTVGLGLINLLFSTDFLNSKQNIVTVILTLLIIVGIGFLVRQGKDWVKYLLLVFTLGGLIGIPFIIKNITLRPIVGLINILQTIMQIGAMLLLFKVPTESDDESNEAKAKENLQ